MSFIKNILRTGIDKTIGTVFKGIDEISTSKEEKAALRSQALQQIIGDRKDARELYKSDSIIQKVFAIVFLLIWSFLLYILLQFFIYRTIKLEEWQIAFLNTIWGAVTMKLGTIIDFLFGGSHNKDVTRK